MSSQSGKIDANLRIHQANEDEATYRTLGLAVRLLEESNGAVEVRSTASIDKSQILSVHGTVYVPGLAGGLFHVRPASALGMNGKVSLNIPIDRISAFFPGDVFASGDLISHLSVSGTSAAPLVNGTVALTSGELRPAAGASLPPIRAIDAHLAVTTHRGEGPTTVRIRSASAELGYAPVTGSGTVTLPASGAPGSFSLKLAGTNALIYTNPTVRVRADTKLALSGAIAPLLPPGTPASAAPSASTAVSGTLSGTISLTHATVREDVPVVNLTQPPVVTDNTLHLVSLPDGLGNSFKLDVVVSADRTLHVENNVYTGDFSANVHLGGTVAVPVPAGEITGSSGVLRLPLTAVQMQNVQLAFPAESPFSPELHATGVSGLRGYNLTLRVDGTLPSVAVSVSSNPALPKEQALLLLTTGYQNVRALGLGNHTITSIGNIVGAQLLRSVFERDRFDRYNLGLAWRIWFR